MTNWVLQTLYGSVLLFLKNEILSHAAAAAYYFLLSIFPFIIVVLYLLNTYVTFDPELSALFFNFLVQLNPQLSPQFFERIGILKAGAAVGGLGLVGILWSTRLIVLSIQQAFRVIFPSEHKRNFIVSNILSLVIVPAALFLLLVSLAFNLIMQFVESYLDRMPFLEPFYAPALHLTGQIIPLAVVFFIIFICYRFLPLVKPSTRHAALGSLACTAAIILLKILFWQFVNVARYNLVYGSIGTLILLMLWVYLVFAIFFLSAQWVYSMQKNEVMGLERLIRVGREDSGWRRWLEKYLFLKSAHLFAMYARHYADGETIFEEGDEGQEIFYVYEGSVAILKSAAGTTHTLAEIPSGQIFGEMACLLNETRTAGARACGRVILLVLSRKTFDELLHYNSMLALQVIESLGQRLKRTTDSVCNQH